MSCHCHVISFLVTSYSHHNDVITSAIVSQIPGVSIVYSPVKFVQEQVKENIKAPRQWPLWGEFIGDWWISRTKGHNAVIVAILWRHHVTWHIRGVPREGQAHCEQDERSDDEVDPPRSHPPGVRHVQLISKEDKWGWRHDMGTFSKTLALSKGNLQIILQRKYRNQNESQMSLA